MSVTSFHAAKAASYVQSALLGFVDDPAESDHQRGYLSALLDVFRHGLDCRANDARIVMLAQQLRTPDPVVPIGDELNEDMLDDIVAQAWLFSERDHRRAIAYLRAAILSIQSRPENVENDNSPEPPEAA